MEIKISRDEMDKSYNDYLNSPEKYCEICSCEMIDKSVSLNCGHKFHYDCLFYSIFKTQSITLNMIKNIRLQCPYCRSDFKYIPLIEGIVPIKNIHKEYDNYILKDNEKYIINNKIKVISGKYKNQYAVIKKVEDSYILLYFENEDKNRKIKKKNIMLL